MRLCAVVALAAALALATAQPSRAADDEPAAGAAPAGATSEPAADFKAAVLDSLKLLGIEHATRIALQEKTRGALGGNFWDYYRRSVRWPRHWEDTDNWLVNYIGHPLHGA